MLVIFDDGKVINRDRIVCIYAGNDGQLAWTVKIHLEGMKNPVRIFENKEFWSKRDACNAIDKLVARLNTDSSVVDVRRLCQE